MFLSLTMPTLREDTFLYLVPTPIGNLEDITLRALNVLREVDLILAEDTRKTGQLLKHYQITNNLQSFHSFNEHKTLKNVVSRLGKKEYMALVSDAGTPGISDPGFLLVRECLAAGIKLEVLPGPTAFVPALVKSGFPCDTFIFNGFLPVKKGRQTAIKSLLEEERTTIFYESPHRILRLLDELLEILGPDRQVSISREISKIHEETISGTLSEISDYYKERGVKGEIVVVISGKSYKNPM